MSEAAFPTGPWEVRESGTALDVCLPAEPDSPTVEVVATVFSGMPTAQLFASAPQLCEALEKAISIARGIEDECRARLEWAPSRRAELYGQGCVETAARIAQALERLVSQVRR